MLPVFLNLSRPIEKNNKKSLNMEEEYLRRLESGDLGNKGARYDEGDDLGLE